MRKVLLVEPGYKTKYPPLALMKISTFHKNAGDKVQFIKGINQQIKLKEFDIVYITSLFTYEAETVIETINFYKEGCLNADIIVGGIYATLMPNHLEAKTGIQPHIGLWMDVEFLPPDYSLIPKHPYANHSFVFITRGCPNKCGFCAVKKLEPKRLINPRWKEHISPQLPNIMVHDNSITSVNRYHFKQIMTYLAATRKPITFDNGFDCRIFSEWHCHLISKLNIRSLRFAFDSAKQDGHIQKAIEVCANNGIEPSKILVYVLFNYRDGLEDALYRAK